MGDRTGKPSRYGALGSAIALQQELGDVLELEAAVRDLLGKANDIVACKAELLEYRNGEQTRLDNAVSLAISENNKKWQSQLDSANSTIQELNKKIEILTLGQVDNYDWRTLMSIASKKFWSWKKSGGE